MKERIYQFRDKVVAVTRGTATRVPLLYRMFGQRQVNLSEATADYSYGGWIKHLAKLHETAGYGQAIARQLSRASRTFSLRRCPPICSVRCLITAAWNRANWG